MSSTIDFSAGSTASRAGGGRCGRGGGCGGRGGRSGGKGHYKPKVKLTFLFVRTFLIFDFRSKLTSFSE